MNLWVDILLLLARTCQCFSSQLEGTFAFFKWPMDNPGRVQVLRFAFTVESGIWMSSRTSMFLRMSFRTSILLKLYFFLNLVFLKKTPFFFPRCVQGGQILSWGANILRPLHCPESVTTISETQVDSQKQSVHWVSSFQRIFFSPVSKLRMDSKAEEVRRFFYDSTIWLFFFWFHWPQKHCQPHSLFCVLIRCR